MNVYEPDASLNVAVISLLMTAVMLGIVIALLVLAW